MGNKGQMEWCTREPVIKPRPTEGAGDTVYFAQHAETT
jgi:hypothetical protein